MPLHDSKRQIKYQLQKQKMENDIKLQNVKNINKHFTKLTQTFIHTNEQNLKNRVR